MDQKKKKKKKWKYDDDEFVFLFVPIVPSPLHHAKDKKQEAKQYLFVYRTRNGFIVDPLGKKMKTRKNIFHYLLPLP